MADNDEPTSTGGDLQSDLAKLKPSASGGGPLNTKRIFLIGLIAVGAFMFYVIFLKQKATTTATTTDPSANSSSVPSSDPSALGSLQTSIDSLQQSVNAQGSQLGTIGQNAAGARTNSSIALNGVNDLLHGSGGGPKPTPGPKPKPTPGPLPRAIPVAAPPVTTHQMIIGAPSTVGHLQQTGLAHQ